MSAHTPLKVIYFPLFNKQHQSRTPQEKRRLVRMLQSLKFLDKESYQKLYQDNLLDKLLEKLHYREIPSGNPVYHDGDIADRFYIILRGKGRSYVRRDANDVEEDVLKVGTNSNVTTNSSAGKPKSGFLSSSSSFSKLSSSPSSSSILNTSLHCKLGNNTGRHSSKEHTPRDLSSFKAAVDSPKNSTDSPYSARSTKSKLSSEGAMVSTKSIFNASREKALIRIAVQQSKGTSPGIKGMLSPELKQTATASRKKNLANALKLSINTNIRTKSDLPAYSAGINMGIGSQDRRLLAQASRPQQAYVMKNGVCTHTPQKEVKSGETFGEINQKGIARSETVIAVEDLHVVSLNAQDYLEIFEEPIREKNERAEIFRSLFGDKFGSRYLAKLTDLFHAHRYNFKEKIYEQGDDIDGIFMVRTGEVQLSVVETEKTEASSHRLAKSVTKKTEISRLIPYQFFGGEDFLGIDQRLYTAEVVTSTADVLFLDSAFIREPFPYTKEPLLCIAEIIEAQFKWQMQHHEEIKQKRSVVKKNLEKLSLEEPYFLQKAYISSKVANSQLTKSQANRRVSQKRLRSNQANSRGSNLSSQPPQPQNRVSSPPPEKSKRGSASGFCSLNDLSGTSFQVRSVNVSRPMTTRPVHQTAASNQDLDEDFPAPRSMNNIIPLQNEADLKVLEIKRKTQNPSRPDSCDEKKISNDQRTSLWKSTLAKSSLRYKNMYGSNQRRLQSSQDHDITDQTQQATSQKANKIVSKLQLSQISRIGKGSNSRAATERSATANNLMQNNSTNSLLDYVSSTERHTYLKQKLHLLSESIRKDPNTRFKQSFGSTDISTMDRYCQLVDDSNSKRVDTKNSIEDEMMATDTDFGDMDTFYTSKMSDKQHSVSTLSNKFTPTKKKLDMSLQSNRHVISANRIYIPSQSQKTKQIYMPAASSRPSTVRLSAKRR